jgi:hypothetical protein
VPSAGFLNHGHGAPAVAHGKEYLMANTRRMQKPAIEELVRSRVGTDLLRHRLPALSSSWNWCQTSRPAQPWLFIAPSSAKY